MRPLVLLVLVWSSAWSSVASAQGADAPLPQERLVHRSLLVARYNPLGLIYEGRIGYRRLLYPSGSAALRDNFVGVGLAPSLSPAFGRVGAVVEVQPASVLNLWGMYEVIGYFGSFDHLQSFPTSDANHADSFLAGDRVPLDVPEPAPYSTTGTQLTLGATLQAKVGPVAARSQARFIRPDVDLKDGDRYYYDVLHDVLAEDGGWFLTQDLDVLYQTDFGLNAGVRWNVTHAFYGEGAGAANPNTPTHRVGPLLAYTFWSKGGNARFDTPTVIFIANWWLQHRYRTGEDASRALPYLALGFAFTGDLLAPH